VSRGRAAVSGRVEGATLPALLGRTTVQDEATMLRTAGGKAGCGGGAPEAGEDGADDEDGAAAEPRMPGKAGAGRGGSWPRSGGRRRRTGGMEGGEGVGGFREAGSGRESRGAKDEGRRGRRWSGWMMTAAEEEDTTTTMAADRG
jgi:hypothetical protein